MSLNELIHRYSPERTREEKLHILDGLAAHLPAPAFLWLGVAAEALKDDDASLRQAALHLLSHAPQGWDLVLVSALTSADEDHQQACLQVLASMAFTSPKLQDAFHSLDGLPGWLPGALPVWEEARQQFPPAVEEMAEETAEVTEAAAESIDAAELEKLQAEHEVALNAVLEQQQIAEARAVELEALQGRMREELESLKQSLETSQRERQVLAESVQETLHTYQQRHSRLVAACVAAAIVAVAGVPAGWAIGSRATLAAAEPEYDYAAITTPAPVHVAAVPAEPMADAEPAPAAEPDPGHGHEVSAATAGVSAAQAGALKEAEAAGYRRAMQALATRAVDLEKQGYLRPAAAIWQSYARLAANPSEAKLGREKSDALLQKLKPEVTARPQVKPPRAHVVRPAAVVKAAPVVPTKLPAPPSPPAADPLEEVIPEEIRSKF